jgi:hypothetical protein
VQEQRKHAYRWLLHWAMLDIRPLQWFGGRGWRSWNPLFWRRESRRVQYAGAVANWLHNLALYSSFDFEGFDEVCFWRDFESVRSRFPEFGLEHYRELFASHAMLPSERDREAKSGATPDTAT